MLIKHKYCSILSFHFLSAAVFFIFFPHSIIIRPFLLFVNSIYIDLLFGVILTPSLPFPFLPLSPLSFLYILLVFLTLPRQPPLPFPPPTHPAFLPPPPSSVPPYAPPETRGSIPHPGLFSAGGKVPVAWREGRERGDWREGRKRASNSL